MERHSSTSPTRLILGSWQPASVTSTQTAFPTGTTSPIRCTVLLAWQDGLKAYAVLVDDEEGEDVDITNPRRPVKIAEYDLDALFPQILQPDQPTLTEVFFHDVTVKRIEGRQVMVAS